MRRGINFLVILLLLIIAVLIKTISSKCFSMYGVEQNGCQMCQGTQIKTCIDGSWKLRDCSDNKFCYDIIYKGGHCSTFCGKESVSLFLIVKL